jgi:hypothetical protein
MPAAASSGTAPSPEPFALPRTSIMRGAAMQKAAQYRVFAKECRDLAEKMNGLQKEKLMEIAEAWETLANEREKAVGQERNGEVSRF